jgi:glycosyltransferase involved in cell wall biosynthesis
MFSILIPTWNNLPYLKCCIESIQKNSTFTHQIIVHVNEGNDGTIDYLNSQNIEFTHSAQNIGICTALNLSSQKATAAYICYFNDDMYALPGWDYCLVNEIEALGHDDFFISSTMIEPKVGNNKNMLQGYDFGDLNNFKEKELIQSYQALVMNDWYGASWPPNVVSKKYWDLVGGYSEEFSPGMYSDPDFSMKIWNAGVRVFKGVGKSRVYHFMSKSTGKVVKNDGRKQFINKWKMTPSYFYKHYLKMGESYKHPLSEPPKAIHYLLMKLKIYFYNLKK